MFEKIQQWINSKRQKESLDFSKMSEDEIRKTVTIAVFAAIENGEFTTEHLTNKLVLKYFDYKELTTLHDEYKK